MKRFKKSKGQAIVEYIIIVVIIAVSALVVLGAFSGRVKNIIASVTNAFGGSVEDQSDDDGTKAKTAIQQAGQDVNSLEP